jgi:hypothetical protein
MLILLPCRNFTLKIFAIYGCNFRQIVKGRALVARPILLKNDSERYGAVRDISLNKTRLFLKISFKHHLESFRSSNISNFDIRQ